MNRLRSNVAWRGVRVALGMTLACVAGVAWAATAETFPGTPPAPGPAPTLHLPVPTVQTLANGLEVISVPRTDVPLVTAQLMLRRGSEMDPSSLAGLADLTATLITRGAGGRSAPQLAAAAEALGGSLQAAADWDSTAVSLTVTTPKLPQALELLSTVVRAPAFAEDEVRRARQQAVDDARLEFSRPIALAALAARREVFGVGAYGHPRRGTPTSLSRITRADVQHLHAAVYRPDNAILILTGDISADAARRLAQTGFGGWAKPAAPMPAPPAGQADKSTPGVLMIDQAGAGQAGVVAGHAAPARSDDGFYVGTVANAVLGGSYSARLNEEIRIKRGLSYGAHSSLEPLRDSGVWLASAQTKNPSAPQVVDLMLDQFQRLRDTPVAEAELASRKATLIGSYGRSLQTTAGLAAQVAALAVYDIPLDAMSQYVDRVQAVTPRQVQAYARRHLDGAQVSVVVVGDAAQFTAAITKAHPQSRQLAATLLHLDDPSARP